MRFGLLLSVAVALIAVFVLWVFVGGTEPLPARFAHSECRKVSLRDASSGKLVAGAEDLAILPERDILVVAAMDRSDETLPFSGIFELSLFDVEQGLPEVQVKELIRTYDVPGGIKPQGIDIAPDGQRLAFVNHVGGRRNKSLSVIDVMEWDGGYFVPAARHEHEAFCRANDLAFGIEGNLLITRDRAQCELRPIDMIPFHATGLLLEIRPEGQLIAHDERYFFPSGIVLGPTGNPIIAETRAARLSGGYVDTVLPGAPDKITVDDVGALVVAVHPSLWQSFLYSNGFAFSSGSRVIRADPERTDLEVLFDDPDGEVMSSVSVGLMHEGKLYMGSNIDEGLIVCGG